MLRPRMCSSTRTAPPKQVPLVHLLFLKPKHIGDALLLTPTLMAVRERYPAAMIWVLVRRGTESILAGCPAIDRIVTTAAPEAKRRGLSALRDDVKLVRELRRQHFDYAFEFSDSDRGRWLAWLSGARERVATRFYARISWLARRAITRFSDTDWLQGHRVEKDFTLVHETISLGSPVPPLAFSRERRAEWSPAATPDEFVVLHPGTRWQRKRWPFERWVELGRMLQARNLKLVLSSGPDAEEREGARRLQQELGPSVLNTDGQTTWAQLAGLLGKARLFVGVDTAAMHLAAACQCPTVALFGPSVLHFWRPWRVAHRVVMPESANEAQETPDFLSRVPSLSTDGVPTAKVYAACLEMLASTRSEAAIR
ncbi:MAG: putative lipopolysaccharide heptosyltransferase III [Verrucomicrobia bacterium]|nr:putative lipopolysaccharide heptosyltransferase III [Verrucomicrobiota bacterium]